MAFGYPVALDVAGRACVVLGGGAAAEERVQALLDAGARVTVVAEAFTDGLEELCRRGQIALSRKAYSDGDLDGVFLAVAATGDRELNTRAFEEADRRRVLLNAVDDNARCHFAFPSILRRGDLVVAVSTGGKAPAFAKRLRRQLAEALGPEYGLVVDVLHEVRRDLAVERASVDFATWAARWQDALDHDLVGLIREGRAAEAEALVRATVAGERHPMQEVAS